MKGREKVCQGFRKSVYDLSVAKNVRNSSGNNHDVSWFYGAHIILCLNNILENMAFADVQKILDYIFHQVLMQFYLFDIH